MISPADIIKLRLLNQQIGRTAFNKPGELLSWMLAMQCQDYAMAKWAIGLRLPGTTVAEIEKAFAEGSILRTHMMRPTWHFVSPEDIRWVLALTSPQVQAFNAPYYKKFGLDTGIFKKSMGIIEKALGNGRPRNRTELRMALAKAKIHAEKERLAFILMYVELEGLICSGPRVNNQFTYALLDQRAPLAKKLPKSEALAALTRKYFISRGPATVHDFSWWSGLSIMQAREGIASLPGDFVREVIDKKEYIFLPVNIPAGTRIQSTFLLPDYDEYGISYTFRDTYNRKNGNKELAALDPSFNHLIVVDGKIGGKWKKKILPGSISVQAACFASLLPSRQGAVSRALKKYLRFVNKS